MRLTHTTPKYVKERLLDLKGEIDCNTLIVGDLNTALSPQEYLIFICGFGQSGYEVPWRGSS